MWHFGVSTQKLGSSLVQNGSFPGIWHYKKESVFRGVAVKSQISLLVLTPSTSGSLLECRAKTEIDCSKNTFCMECSLGVVLAAMVMDILQLKDTHKGSTPNITLHGGAAATLTPISLHCATKSCDVHVCPHLLVCCVWVCVCLGTLGDTGGNSETQ